MNNYDYIVQEREPEFDRSVLHQKLFPVNIRLLKSSEPYRNLIADVLDYMNWILQQKFDDYKSASDDGLYGISGANLGIPWNIIGYKHNANMHYMINPIIVDKSEEMVLTKSNCGSIKYKEKIPVKRHKWIIVESYDIEGKMHKRKFTGKESGYTIQHEIDHNNGILISDRFLEQGGDANLLNKI